VLVTAARPELAGDVGSLRGVTQNLAAAVGTALMGALLVGLLSTIILNNLSTNPVLKANLAVEVDMDSLNFASNERLLEILERTPATPEQVEEAVRINTESRLRALKTGFLVLSGLSLLAIVPCSWLPNYRPGEIPREEDEPGQAGRR